MAIVLNEPLSRHALAFVLAGGRGSRLLEGPQPDPTSTDGLELFSPRAERELRYFLGAERLCRTADRIDPARVFGSRHCLGRGTSAPNSEILRSLLQWRQNTSVSKQSYAILGRFSDPVS